LTNTVAVGENYKMAQKVFLLQVIPSSLIYMKNLDQSSLKS